MGIDLLQPSDRINAVEMRHGDIRHDHVRPQFFGCRDQRVSILDGGDEITIIAE
jgi:hypothetical protein